MKDDQHDARASTASPPASAFPDARAFSDAIAGASEGLWQWDIEGGEVHYSAPWYRLCGLEPRDLPADVDTWLGRVHTSDIEPLREAIRRHLTGETGRFRHEFRLAHSEGGYRWMVATGVAVRDATGRPIRLAGSLSDVSDRRFYDPLTGLPNRHLLADRIAGACARLERDKGQRFAVLVADLDRFKRVQLSLGHARSERLLVGVAERLQAVVRAREGAHRGDLVARFGVDEFGVVLHDIPDASVAMATARAIHEALEAPIELDGEPVFATASVGITISAPRHLTDGDPLQEAITATDVAKGNGSNRWAVYSVGMNAAARNRLRFETDLRRAVAAGAIHVHYQPIVDLRTQAILGFEALARWNRPTHGAVSPQRFIAVAEEANLIHHIGRSVLDQAFRDMARWLDGAGHGRDLKLSVNLSARQLLEPGLVGQIADSLAQSGLPPERVKLEITESVMLTSASRATKVLDDLKALGVAITIDDFGTGYSSLSYLHKLPIDEVKIDRSFVLALCDDEDSLAIVDTIITLADKLGFSVVAEGIETVDQRDRLEGLGCRVGQGFLWDQALPPAEIPALLGRGAEGVSVR